MSSDTPSWLATAAVRLVLPAALLLCIVFIASLHNACTKHRQKQKGSKEFHAFADEHGCAVTPQTLPYGIIPSLLNKLNLLKHLKGDLLGGTFGEKFKTYGPTHALYDNYGLTKVVHSIDPANVHTVLSSRSEDYGIPAARLSAIGPVGSKGVVMTDSNLWQQNRKAINRGFRGARLTDGIEENIQTLFQTVATSTESNGWTKPFPFFDAFAFMSLDRSIRHMFGVRSDLQAESGEPMKQRLRWKDAFDIIAKYVSVRSVLGTKSWLYDGFPFRRACAMLRDLCAKTIEAATQKSKAGIATSGSFVGNLV
jgi:cytochrome P450